MKTIGLLHGAGYVGGELIRLLAGHPQAELALVTSRSQAGQPVWHTHPALRSTTDLAFADADADVNDLDAVLIAAEHGQGAAAVARLLDSGFSGKIVDLSADFRFAPGLYPSWFGFEHPHPELAAHFIYGVPEFNAPYPEGKHVANPGCFATGLNLALRPLADALGAFEAAVTALTGASGSGARPKETTHFPTRDGNVRSYKTLVHQHLPEVQQLVGPAVQIAFAPASGPWTRGIWGTVHAALPDDVTAATVADAYQAAYAEAPCVRLWPDVLPELRFSVGTPFCDVGWIVKEHRLVVGFALDNLLKGAASQAIQNLNLLLGVPESSGLVW